MHVSEIDSEHNLVFATPSDRSRVASGRAGFGMLLVSLLLAFSLAMAGCAAEGEGIFTAEERNAFTDLANQWAATADRIVDQVNKAVEKGEFGGLKSETDPLFSQMDQQIGSMQQQASKLKGNPQVVANQMIATAQEWSQTARKLVEAATNSDETTYQATLVTLNSLQSQFNSLVGQWNTIQTR